MTMLGAVEVHSDLHMYFIKCFQRNVVGKILAHVQIRVSEVSTHEQMISNSNKFNISKKNIWIRCRNKNLSIIHRAASCIFSKAVSFTLE